MLYFKTDTTITVYFSNGDVACWNKTNPIFEKICELAQKEDWLPIEVLHQEAKTVMGKDVKIQGNDVTITHENREIKIADLEEAATPLMKFIKLLKDKGVIDTEINRIRPFLQNMFENPYIDAVTEIYDYCTKMDFEITEDGCFLAYKNVNKDFSSIHDGGLTKHKIGEYTTVETFCTDRTRTCAEGLHFCSKGYLDVYSGEVTIIVKINPKDVVSIPIDYNFEKGRCCRYMMVGVLGKEGDLETTDIEAMTEGQVKTVKTEERAKADKTKAEAKGPDRITETVTLMLQHDGNKNLVAAIMKISADTVSRNMRKAKARGEIQ